MRSVTQSWEDWVVLFSRRDVRPVRGLSADLFWSYLRGEIPDKHLDKGRAKKAFDVAKDGAAVSLSDYAVLRRANENVRSVHALALDMDDCGEEQVLAALEKLSSYDYFAWTTYKHTAARPKIRVIVPLSEPVVVGDYTAVWGAWNAFTSSVTDRSTSDAARLLYLPSCPPETESEAWCVRHDGGTWLAAADLGAASAPAVLRPDAAQAPADEVLISMGVDAVRTKLRCVPRDNTLLKGPALAVLKGAEFAVPGARHAMILSLTFYLASQLTKRDVPPEAVSRVFAASLAAMATDQTERDVENAYAGALGKVREAERLIDGRMRGAHAAAQPYAKEELEALAARAGVASPDDLRHRWVVQRGSQYYFLRGDGTYSEEAKGNEDARLEAVRTLARAPVDLNEVSRSGVSRKPVNVLAEEYGSRADVVVLDLVAQATTAEADGDKLVLRVAACPRRLLVPRRDPDVEHWLEVFAGPLHEKVLDWLACFPDLNKLLCALYVTGASSAGKTLLAKALARIWSRGAPTEPKAIFQDFNEHLTKCPLVFVDEHCPVEWNGEPASAILRRVVGDMSRNLRGKWKQETSLVGAVRVLLADNNGRMLRDGDHSQGGHDRVAIAKRFLCVEIREEAKTLLDQFAARNADGLQPWIDDDVFARHVMWLAETREVKRTGRFWVEGEEGVLARRLALGGSDWNEWTCEWLVRYLDSPGRHDCKQDKTVVRGGGMLLVNPQALTDGWTMYLKTKREPETHKIVAALEAISQEKRPVEREGRRFYRIDPAFVYDYAEKHALGDEAKIRAAVEDGTPNPPAPVEGNVVKGAFGGRFKS